MLFKDKVIVDGDSKGDSFLIALDRDNGETLWRINRVNKGISYSAALIRELAGRTQLIQCGDRCVAGSCRVGAAPLGFPFHCPGGHHVQ